MFGTTRYGAVMLVESPCEIPSTGARAVASITMAHEVDRAIYSKNGRRDLHHILRKIFSSRGWWPDRDDRPSGGQVVVGRWCPLNMVTNPQLKPRQLFHCHAGQPSGTMGQRRSH